MGNNRQPDAASPSSSHSSLPIWSSVSQPALDRTPVAPRARSLSSTAFHHAPRRAPRKKAPLAQESRQDPKFSKPESRGEAHEHALGLVDGDLVLGDVTGADADGFAEGAVGPPGGREDPLALLGDGEKAGRRWVVASTGHRRRGVQGWEEARGGWGN